MSFKHEWISRYPCRMRYGIRTTAAVLRLEENLSGDEGYEYTIHRPYEWITFTN